ncbi:hypothetical protein CTI12_AA123730 [Artemisia annua]|uniref:Uncharacterized protein n=1 Tax=Artemisia annua TaxID=35608 RepID=A0A2U1PQX7_ARTAN|nr:hypothetical protein CTI12_AA123730 [Artemisia annua]
MGSEMKSGGFRAKMEHYLYSGEKKHVFAGMAIITVIFGVPWYLMNREVSPSAATSRMLPHRFRHKIRDTFGSPKYFSWVIRWCLDVSFGSTKQLSHQDYLEKADRARNARLHSAPPPESK